MVVLRRAHDLKLIPDKAFRRHADLLRKRPLDTGGPKGEGGDFYATFFTRNSRTFTSAQLTALLEQRVLHRDAARLLNVRVGILPRVEQHLFGGM